VKKSAGAADSPVARLDCAEHLLALVSDILDFERIESNQLQLETIPFSIVDEAQKAVSLLQITAGTALRLCFSSLRSSFFVLYVRLFLLRCSLTRTRYR
jgi:signal transduction histidine kinase